MIQEIQPERRVKAMFSRRYKSMLEYTQLFCVFVRTMTCDRYSGLCLLEP